MRVLVSVGLPLVLVSCLVIPLGGGGGVVVSGGGVSGGAGEGASVESEQQVRARLKTLQAHILEGTKQLRSVPCSAGECFRQEDVRKLVSDIRSELKEAFPEDAAALYEAIDAVIVEEVRRLGPPQPLTAIHPVRLQESTGALGYAAAAVAAMLNGMAEGVQRFLSYDDLALDLYVQSSPAYADFVIQMRDNLQTRRGTHTNGKIPNVWRGKYTAVIKKNEYKDGGMAGGVLLDLFSDGRTGIACTLRGKNETGESVCTRY